MTNKLVCSVIECPATAGEANASILLYWDNVGKFPNFKAYAAGGMAAMIAADINTNAYDFNGNKLRAAFNGNSLLLIGASSTDTPTEEVVHLSFSAFPNADTKSKWTNVEIANPYQPGVSFSADDVAARFAAGCAAGAILSRTFA